LWRIIVPKVGRLVQWAISVAVLGAAAHAQDFDANKSPAQIFSDTCNACHRSPREIKQTTPGFMREHYTTSGREAAAMAAYLTSVGSDPRAVKQRRPPALGADQAPRETTLPSSPPQDADQAAIRPTQTVPPDTNPAELPETQAVLPTTTPVDRKTPAAAKQANAPERAKSSQGGVTAVKPRRPSESVEMGVPPQTAATPFPQQNSLADFEE
jgi:hypothetical protein